MRKIALRDKRDSVLRQMHLFSRMYDKTRLDKAIWKEIIDKGNK